MWLFVHTFHIYFLISTVSGSGAAAVDGGVDNHHPTAESQDAKEAFSTPQAEGSLAG